MANIKKLIEEAEHRQRSVRPSSGWDKERAKESDNIAKAHKILTFADPVLKEFARHVEKGLRKGRGRSSHGECLAWYEIYTKNLFGMYKSRTATMDIIIGVKGGNQRLASVGYVYSTGVVLIVCSTEYGEDTPIEEINEQWLVEILTTKFREHRRHMR